MLLLRTESGYLIVNLRCRLRKTMEIISSDRFPAVAAHWGIQWKTHSYVRISSSSPVDFVTEQRLRTDEIINLPYMTV